MTVNLLPAMGDEHKRACERIVATLDRDALRARERCIVRGYFKRATYRGRPCIEAGYQWMRPNAHFMTGRVYECAVARATNWVACLVKAEATK